jgi:hypothetical protein
MAEFKLPTETVKLPSKGLVYPKENPLSSGEIEMKYMTAKEEDILSNTNYIQQGIVFDKLFQSLIISKINYDDLVIGDKDAIMIAARILGYGKNYEVQVDHPQTGEKEDFIIDISEFKEKPLDLSLFDNKNEFHFVLPNTKNEVSFKLLTHADEKIIEKEIKAQKKINVSSEITLRLKQQILSVNGNTDKKVIREFVDTALLAADSIELRKYINKISPGVDMTFTFTSKVDGYVEEGVSLPMNLTFFYPKL